MVEAAGNVVTSPDEDAYSFVRQTVTEATEQGVCRPELGDAPELAQMFWSGIHGIISLWFTHCDDPHIVLRDPRETVRTMCDAMIRGSLRNFPDGLPSGLLSHGALRRLSFRLLTYHC